MQCWNLFGHPHLNYSAGPATVVNCNLNRQLMNIQLTQQILVCFTALLLNILYPYPYLHVFMNPWEKRCLLKSLVKPRLKCPGEGWRLQAYPLSLRRVPGGWAGRIQGWKAQRGQGLALRSHNGSKAQTGLSSGEVPIATRPQINWRRGSGDVWLWDNVRNVEGSILCCPDV